MNAPSGPSAIPAPRHEIVASLCSVGRFFDNFQLVHALLDVSFEVRRAEILGLLGPKDSGKTTTLRLLAGQLSPSEGKVKVFGRSPRWPSIKARVGYLAEPAGDSFAPAGSGLRSFLRDLFSRLPGRSGKTIAKPSSAAQRTLALSQLLLKSPELVLLDEPFTELDSEGCRDMRELILALSRRGKTVVLTSRSFSEAKDVCSRLAVYYAGRIQAIGTLEELLAHPEALRFSAPLLPPQTTGRLLNVLRAELEQDIPPSETAARKLKNVAFETAPCLGPSPVATAADTALAPLLKAPDAEPSPPAPAPATDAVNHEKLANLTRSASLPGEPGQCGPLST
jgi:ABC-type multidrug transport system ATPase subunit